MTDTEQKRQPDQRRSQPRRSGRNRGRSRRPDNAGQNPQEKREASSPETLDKATGRRGTHDMSPRETRDSTAARRERRERQSERSRRGERRNGEARRPTEPTHELQAHETWEDIARDNLRIEKEIELERAEIRSLSLD